MHSVCSALSAADAHPQALAALGRGRVWLLLFAAFVSLVGRSEAERVFGEVGFGTEASSFPSPWDPVLRSRFVFLA